MRFIGTYNQIINGFVKCCAITTCSWGAGTLIQLEDNSKYHIDRNITIIPGQQVRLYSDYEISPDDLNRIHAIEVMDSGEIILVAAKYIDDISLD